MDLTLLLASILSAADRLRHVEQAQLLKFGRAEDLNRIDSELWDIVESIEEIDLELEGKGD